MTPQEQEMIGDLIDRVQKTQLDEKDVDAERMLQEGLGRNPDSLYILAQTVLVQKYALEQAQAQLTQAKAQIEQMQQHPEPKHATSFLGSLLGRHDDPAPPPPVPAQSYPAQGGQGWQQVNTSYAGAPPQYGTPQYGPPPVVAGGGFLRGAMQTAAGVAAGALAFQGIESLMNGFGHAAGYGHEFGAIGGAEQPVEVVNNYYGDDRGGQGVTADEQTIGSNEDRDFGGNDNSSNDAYAAEDSNDMYAAEDDATSDTDYDNTADDDSGSDFSDDSGGDDGSFA